MTGVLPQRKSHAGACRMRLDPPVASSGGYACTLILPSPLARFRSVVIRKIKKRQRRWTFRD